MYDRIQITKETLKEKPQSITKEAFDTANKIFQSFPATDETSRAMPAEHRTKSLSDGSQILILKATTVRLHTDTSDNTFMFSIRPVRSTLINPLFFVIDQDGLKSLSVEINPTIGKSKIPNTSANFSAESSDMQDNLLPIDARKPFHAASRELVNWVAKCIEKDRFSKPPISIKPRIKY